ncbi:MAG: SMI1/KNR4 family protein [Gemmataceae bacterium]
MATDVVSAWHRLRGWIATNAPEWDQPTWPSGATQHELLEVEQNLGLILPEDFKEFYSVHNGTGSFFLPRSGPLLPLRQIMKTRREHIKLENHPDKKVETRTLGIKPIWYSRKRLRINGEWPEQMLDLDPSPEGTYGQIIQIDKYAGPNEIVASGFGDLIRNLADVADAGGLDEELEEYRAMMKAFKDTEGLIPRYQVDE